MVVSDIITAVLTNSNNLIYQWGYLGVFVFSLISSASLFFFPFPSQALIFAAGGILNPFGVAIFGTVGSVIGDSLAYVLGLGGKEILEKKYQKQIDSTRKSFEKHGAFILVFIASLLPLPLDVVSIFCGIIRYDFKKYIVALVSGKFIRHIIVAYAGAGLFSLV